MKKISLLFLLILFFTSGCLNYTELSDIGIINAIGINKDNNNYIININMLTPSEKNLDENKSFQVEATSLDEAFDKLYLLTSKDINLSHLELLLLNNNLSKNDYDNIINFFLKRNDSRNNFNTIIVENYSNENIFKYDPLEINRLIKTNSLQDGVVIYKSFDQIIEDILNIKISYIPTIQIEDGIKILGYRSIYKSNKLLTIKESISYNFLTNKIIKCNLTDESLNIKVDKSLTSIFVNKNTINININSTLTNYSNDNDVESKYNRVLKNYLEDFLNNNDLSYFKNLIKKQNFNYYKNNKIEKLNFNIKVNGKNNREVTTNER